MGLSRLLWGWLAVALWLLLWELIASRLGSARGDGNCWTPPTAIRSASYVSVSPSAVRTARDAGSTDAMAHRRRVAPASVTRSANG